METMHSENATVPTSDSSERAAFLEGDAHTEIVLIKPKGGERGGCNLRCQYCYLPDDVEQARIEFETLDKIYERVAESPFISGKLTVLWHATEPLMLPPSFYEKAFAMQERLSKRVQVTNAIQTNGTLITDRWCKLFKKHGVQVGVSLDGPQDMHDANRVYASGKGSFERAMRGLNLLEAHGISHTIISVVTANTVKDPTRFWKFFSELNHKHFTLLGLNPEEIEGANTKSSLSPEEAMQEYRNFFREIVAHALNGGNVRVREIRNILAAGRAAVSSANSMRLSGRQTNRPMAIISFDHQGNFSTFSPEMLSSPEYAFGNVSSNKLEDMYRNPKFQAVHAEIQQGITRCQQTCEYFSCLCEGGDPSNKLAEHGGFGGTETIACRTRIKIPTDEVLRYYGG